MHRTPYCSAGCSYIFRSLLSWYTDGIWARRLGFDCRQRQEIILYSTASTQALGPTQPPIQWVSVALSPDGKATRSLSWPLTSILCRRQEWWSSTSIRRCLRGVVLKLSTWITLHLSIIIFSMLGGSLVTTRWRVLRLRMEESPSRYGG
jgi:hypothetical protein